MSALQLICAVTHARAVIGTLSGVGIAGDVAIQLETINCIPVPESRIHLVSDEIFSCKNLV